MSRVALGTSGPVARAIWTNPASYHARHKRHVLTHRIHPTTRYGSVHDVRPPGYLNVKEAARRYGVSRAKLHRLIRLGRLPTTKDPRDKCATLVCAENLDKLFRFPEAQGLEKAEPVEVQAGGGLAMAEEYRVTPDRVTSERWARIVAVRLRIATDRQVLGDSTEILMEERELRSRELDQADDGSEGSRSS